LTCTHLSFAISSKSHLSFLLSFFGIFIEIEISKSHFLSLSMYFTQSQWIFNTFQCSVPAFISIFLFQIIGIDISFEAQSTASTISISVEKCKSTQSLFSHFSSVFTTN